MICSSKMFGSRLRDIAPIRGAVVAYVTKAAEKLRSQQSLAGALQVAIRTGMHNPNQPRYANAISCPLPYPTDDTRVLAAAAVRGRGDLPAWLRLQQSRGAADGSAAARRIHW